MFDYFKCINFFLMGKVGPKKAREMWFMTRFYTAAEAEKMGLVNTVVPVSSLQVFNGMLFNSSATKCSINPQTNQGKTLLA